MSQESHAGGASNSDPTKAAAHDGVASVAVGDTVLVLWKSPATIVRWRWVQDRIDTVAATHKSDGVIVILLILPSSDPPDAATRAMMQTEFRRPDSGMRLYIATPLGGSLWQSLVRTIVRATFLLSGQSHRQVVASDLEDAIRRTREAGRAATPSAEQIRSAAAELYAALEVSPPS